MQDDSGWDTSTSIRDVWNRYCNDCRFRSTLTFPHMDGSYVGCSNPDSNHYKSIINTNQLACGDFMIIGAPKKKVINKLCRLCKFYDLNSKVCCNAMSSYFNLNVCTVRHIEAHGDACSLFEPFKAPYKHNPLKHEDAVVKSPVRLLMFVE